MSFNDLAGSSTGTGRGSGSGSGSPGPVLPLYATDTGAGANAEFERLSKRLGIQIFKITSNVTAIQKLVSLQSKGQSQGQGQDFTKRM